MGGWMNGWMYGGDGWMDERMDGWTAMDGDGWRSTTEFQGMGKDGNGQVGRRKLPPGSKDSMVNLESTSRRSCEDNDGVQCHMADAEGHEICRATGRVGGGARRCTGQSKAIHLRR